MPILLFTVAIFAGALALRLPFCLAGGELSFVDALFTATSAVCVTGLVVQDTGGFFSQSGQTVILILIQLGGLGVMTYTSLAMILWRRRVSLTDRLAVGQSLLHDPGFKLGRFLLYLCLGMAAIELLGAALLYAQLPDMTFFSAIFHSISALCNAGFSLNADSLIGYRDNLGVNLTFMALIVVGGLGFSTVMETARWLWRHARKAPRRSPPKKLSLHVRVVWSTSFWLILIGAVAMYFAERFEPGTEKMFSPLMALFQSVTTRTAGFNSVDIGQLGNLSLLFMMLLMFIGGSPGSCAGGVKTTTFRAILGFVSSQMRGRSQTVVMNRALDNATLSRAFILIVFGLSLVFAGALVLCVTEGQAGMTNRGLFINALFESFSAFGTVGLSTGLTPSLSVAGKIVLMPLMLLGRVGPIVFLGVVQDLQTPPRFTWPEETLMIG